MYVVSMSSDEVLCDILREFGKSELLDAFERVIHVWLSNDMMDFMSLYKMALLTFGEKGEGFILLLTTDIEKVLLALDKCFENVDDDEVIKIREFIAKYYPLLHVEVRKRSVPYLATQFRAIPVNRKPVVIRIEAKTIGGKDIILEIGMSDISMILDAVKEVDKGAFLKLIAPVLDDVDLGCAVGVKNDENEKTSSDVGRVGASCLLYT